MSVPSTRDMPTGALLASAFAPIVAGFLRVLAPARMEPYVLLLWMLGFVSVFLMTRYMAWNGALLALAWTVLSVLLAELVVSRWFGGTLDWRLVGAVTVVIASASLGAGLQRQFWAARVAPPAAGEERRESETQLPSREVLEFFLSKVFAGARRSPPLSVVLFAIDHFEEYEKLYGHDRVVHALDALVGALDEHSRAMNVYGRYDEKSLLVLLHGENLTASHAFARRILDEVADYEAPWAGRVTVSAGIAGFEPAIERPDLLLEQARDAQQAAASMGGGAVVYRGKLDEPLATPGMMVLEADGRLREIHLGV